MANAAAEAYIGHMIAGLDPMNKLVSRMADRDEKNQDLAFDKDVTVFVEDLLKKIADEKAKPGGGDGIAVAAWDRLVAKYTKL